VSARFAVFTLLTTDPELNDMGIDADHCWPAHALDNPPRTGPFLVLRWEETTTEFNTFGAREVLTVWAHCPKEISNDFVPLLMMLKRVMFLLLSAEHVVGEDGVLTKVDYQGMSPDLRDEGFSTITKNAAFRVLSR
jgi:hypothetical protein